MGTSNAFMSPQELAKYLGCTRRTIYKKISTGEIRGVKIFGRWRFSKSKIDAWIKGREQAQATRRFGERKKAKV